MKKFSVVFCCLFALFFCKAVHAEILSHPKDASIFLKEQYVCEEGIGSYKDEAPFIILPMNDEISLIVCGYSDNSKKYDDVYETSEFEVWQTSPSERKMLFIAGAVDDYKLEVYYKYKKLVLYDQLALSSSFDIIKPFTKTTIRCDKNDCSIKRKCILDLKDKELLRKAKKFQDVREKIKSNYEIVYDILLLAILGDKKAEKFFLEKEYDKLGFDAHASETVHEANDTFERVMKECNIENNL